jgi:benzoyl-CoA 2,3-dioxygenase component A
MAVAQKQHLIDPEICIRCNTCEETCPVDAISHDDNNYVVDASKCNFCLDCISPCPTGSIDEQYSWRELPAAVNAVAEGGEAVDSDIELLLQQAHSGAGGRALPPASAARPAINLYNRSRPAIATVAGNFRLTEAGAENDVRHIILDFGDLHFPVLEGQSIGIVPPGRDDKDEPHRVRLYSLASPRHGERPNANNLALTVKREPKGVCSNYLCDLAKGDKVDVTGPFGGTFLMANDPAAHLIMICTGTGSAPFRAFTEWRRRMMPDAPGRLMLFFGARRPEELPYFGPLQKVPATLLAKHFAYSRVPDAPKTYVQDVMRREAESLAALLPSPQTHIYICGLKGMEQGVDAALDDICRSTGLHWRDVCGTMRESGRYHVETY